MMTAAAKPEPGQVAYEARFEGFNLGPRGVSEAWEKLQPEARAKWARVEAAVLAARPLTPLGHLGGFSVNKAAHHAGGLDLAAHILRAKDKAATAKSCDEAAAYLRALIEEALAAPALVVPAEVRWLVDLVEELCDAFDNGASGIGGRHPAEVLKQVGQALDAAKRILATPPSSASIRPDWHKAMFPDEPTPANAGASEQQG